MTLLKRSKRARKRQVYFFNEINIHIYNFTPNPHLTKTFITFFHILALSRCMSNFNLTHVRTEVCHATPQ